jgi:hypothetical protein
VPVKSRWPLRPAMDRAARGEHIARRGPPSECLGCFRCKNPRRVADAVHGLPWRRLRSGKGRSILWGAAGPPLWRLGCQARERRSREHPGQGLRRTYPRRAKPKGASSRRRVNRSLRVKGLPEGQKPRSRGLPGRPSASAVGETGGKTACGSGCGGNAAATFRQEKAPKGESHERRRRETKPARARREEAATRVTKP